MRNSIWVVALIVSGCASPEIIPVAEPIKSNLVYHPAHEYQGVDVVASTNWMLGHGDGIRGSEKLSFLEPEAALMLADGASGKISMAESTCASAEVDVPDAKILGSWSVHFKTNETDPFDLENVQSGFAEVKPDVVVISGYTDNIGSDTYNLALSKKRANGVKESLKANYWPDAQINVKWGGSCPRLVANTDEDSRQRNRRVTIVAYKKDVK